MGSFEEYVKREHMLREGSLVYRIEHNLPCDNIGNETLAKLTDSQFETIQAIERNKYEQRKVFVKNVTDKIKKLINYD